MIGSGIGLAAADRLSVLGLDVAFAVVAARASVRPTPDNATVCGPFEPGVREVYGQQGPGGPVALACALGGRSLTAINPDPRWRFNEGRLRSFRETGRLIAFVCECGDSACKRSVLLTAEEYEALRPGLILHESHPPDLV